MASLGNVCLHLLIDPLSSIFDDCIVPVLFVLCHCPVLFRSYFVRALLIVFVSSWLVRVQLPFPTLATISPRQAIPLPIQQIQPDF